MSKEHEENIKKEFEAAEGIQDTEAVQEKVTEEESKKDITSALKEEIEKMKL